MTPPSCPRRFVRTPSWARHSVWPLAAALLLAACSTPDTDHPAPTADGTPDGPPPIEAAFAQIYGTAGLTAEELETQRYRANLSASEQVAACMAKEGFTYVPWAPSEAISGVASVDLPEYAALDPVERARQLGYGFIADIRAWNGGANPNPNQNPIPDPDPNVTIRESLSLAEREAYDRALTGYVPGEEPATDPNDGAPVWGSDGADYVPGCQSEGVSEAMLAWGNDSRWLDLLTGVDAARTRFAEDARVVALDSAWTDCMADAGYPGLASMSDAYLLATQAWSTWRDSPDSDGTLLPPDRELDAMQAHEIAVATADARCQQDLDYVAIRRTVQDEIEGAFVAERAADIAALTTAYATTVGQG